MKIKKYPETLPDLVVHENKHEYGVGYLINCEDRWWPYKLGYKSMTIYADREYNDLEPLDRLKTPHYYLEFDDIGTYIRIFAAQEKDQFEVLVLNEKGQTDLL